MNDTIFAVQFESKDDSEARLFSKCNIADEIQLEEVMVCARCGGECKVM